MFDHIVLNVVTGLVFIYLLYSLLVTISVEFFSSKLGLRPRLLRFAVERMLNDGYYERMKKNAFNKVRNYLRERGKERILRKKKEEVAALKDDTSKSKLQRDILKKWEEKGVPDQELTGEITMGINLINIFEWVFIGCSAWLRRLMLFESTGFKKSFAGKFYDYPSIKYLTKSEAAHKTFFSNTKPSYFSGENFGDTVANMLKDKGVGTTEGERVDFCLTFNPYNIQPQTLKQLRNLWKDSALDVTMFRTKLKQWFDETMDRTNGWYKQKMQLVSLIVGFIITAAFNVDTIQITHVLSKDKDAQNQLVEMSIRTANDPSYNDHTQPHADSVREHPVDSVYKKIQKDIRAANAILGMGWNLETLQEGEQVAIKKKDNTELFYALAGERKSFTSIDSVTKITLRLARCQKERDALLLDVHVLTADADLLHEDQTLLSLKLETLKAQRAKEAQKVKTRSQSDTTAKSPNKENIKRDSLKLVAVTERIENNLDDINIKLIAIKFARLWVRRDSMALQTYQAKTTALREKINTLANKDFVSILGIKEVDPGTETASLCIEGMVHWGFFAKTWYWLRCVGRNFWGLFITAIALSFGAPFWFDMLKKIISLRTAGVKPEEKPVPKDTPEEPNKPAAAPPAVPAKSIIAISSTGKDQVDEALRIYGPDIRAMAGVKSVVAFMQDIVTKTRNLQINVIDQLTHNAVTQKYGSLLVNGLQISPVIKVTGQPTTHQGAGIIHPKNAQHNAGSIGCVVKQADSDLLHILSCWHVLKDLGNRQTVTSIIQDHAGKGLADRWAGGISGAFDYGLARCLASASVTSNAFLKEHLKPGGNRVAVRAVANDDIDHQVTVQYVDFLSNPPVVKQGQIFTDTMSVEIQYADARRTVNDVLVITETVANQKTISQPGNSGALVFDVKFKAIGMIIAGDNDFTYAVKLSNIFKLHKDLTIL